MSDGMKILPGQVTQLTSHEVESENRMVRQFAGCGFNGKAAPPLPIRAPGHGQVTEEERVERVRKAFRVAWDTMAHVDINIDRDKIWFDKNPTLIEAMFGLSDAIKALTAAAAVPGPAVEWTGEPPKETGWKMGSSVCVFAEDMEGRDLKSGDTRLVTMISCREVAKRLRDILAISELLTFISPPVTKGEG